MDGRGRARGVFCVGDVPRRIREDGDGSRGERGSVRAVVAEAAASAFRKRVYPTHTADGDAPDAVTGRCGKGVLTL